MDLYETLLESERLIYNGLIVHALKGVVLHVNLPKLNMVAGHVME